MSTNWRKFGPLAENERDKAIKNLKNFKIEEFNRNFRNGEAFLGAEEYCFARFFFQDADSTAKDHKFNSGIEGEKIKYIDSVLNDLKNRTQGCE